MDQKEDSNKKKVQENVQGWIIIFALNGLVFLCGLLWHDLWINLLQGLFSKLSPFALYNTILLLLFLLLLSFSSFFYFRTKHIPWRFYYDDKSGVLIHKRHSDKYFCTKCILTKRIESPLTKRLDAWYCPACDKKYPNPDYRRPKPKPIRFRSNWMDDLKY